jgi:proteasome beta subunit
MSMAFSDRGGPPPAGRHGCRWSRPLPSRPIADTHPVPAVYHQNAGGALVDKINLDNVVSMDETAQSAMPATFLAPTSSSFIDLLRTHSPELMPYRRVGAGTGPEAPHGTTIVAATFSGGVLIAGDRRTTMGQLIAGRDLDKLSITDEYSAVGFAGTVGISIEMGRLFAMELEHYEKLEGVPLSLEGKSNRLAAMVKGNLEMASAGMVSMPLFVGFDPDAEDQARGGHIVSFDVVGGRHEERGGYHGVGSGSPYAMSSLKKLHDPQADAAAALRALLESLYDAADDDSASAGPDLVRRIFPTAIKITADGAVRVAEEEIANVTEAVVAGRIAAQRNTPA